MKTVRIKAYAKVNLFLDIVGKENGYHLLDTVVTTVDLFDSITLTARKDKKIVLKTGGGLYSVTENSDNNAYKAAALYSERFSTAGADIVLNKHIPVGSGLGGSSADIAGVLIGMEKLYSKCKDLKPLADELGSDSGYLLSGGWARLKGRGEIVEKLDIDKKLYFFIITADGGVNTSECYRLYDSTEKAPVSFGADKLISDLSSGDAESYDLYNALYAPATTINENVKKAYEFIKDLSPKAVVMSGSGSSVAGIFDTAELCQWAQAKAKYLFKNTFVTESLSDAEIKKRSGAGRTLYSPAEAD